MKFFSAGLIAYLAIFAIVPLGGNAEVAFCTYRVVPHRPPILPPGVSRLTRMAIEQRYMSIPPNRILEGCQNHPWHKVVLMRLNPVNWLRIWFG